MKDLMRVSAATFTGFLLCLLACVSCTEPLVDSDTSDSSEPSTEPSDTTVDASEDVAPVEPSEDSQGPDDNNDEEQTDASSPDEPSEPGAPVEPEDDGPLDGFGEISGACGILDLMTRQQTEPFLVRNAIDFDDDPYDDSDLDLLTDGGREIVSDGNAGGSSLLSELFAFEVLARCEDAQLIKTETEITYSDPSGKKTDLLVMVGESRLGVSVTRAVGYPRDDPYTVEIAQALLEQKLSGVVSSTANMSDEDVWSKQILHIVAYADEHALSLETAYELISEDVRSNTVVWVTVSHGDDEFLY